MTTPRSQQVDLSATPYYHVVSRCVRRAFLCGKDKLTGKDFDHRRGWLVERFRSLAGSFAIDVCAFAVLSNHYHLILHVNREHARQWSDDEVVRRWGRACRGGAAYRYARNEPLSDDDRLEIVTRTPLWRQRLHDLSWFMKMLNEFVARRANQEDECKGHFWESRFKSQALLDERAILGAMAYVDLNPIRAKLAHSLIESDYTSVQERIVLQAKASAPGSAIAGRALKYDVAVLPPLLSFADIACGDISGPSQGAALPCTLGSYLALVEWTGQQLHDDKRGTLASGARSVLEGLTIDQEEWLNTVRGIRNGFGFAIGPLDLLRSWRDKLKRSWIKGMGKKPHRAAAQST
jgi:REP element-mobilizing transposase RayT